MMPLQIAPEYSRDTLASGADTMRTMVKPPRHTASKIFSLRNMGAAGMLGAVTVVTCLAFGVRQTAPALSPPPEALLAAVKPMATAAAAAGVIPALLDAKPAPGNVDTKPTGSIAPAVTARAVPRAAPPRKRLVHLRKPAKPKRIAAKAKP